MAYDALVQLALDEYPLEACGLLAGPPSAGDGIDGDGIDGDGAGRNEPAIDRGATFYPCTNIAGSARVYTIDPKDHLRAEMDADDNDHEINGVVHSHTHSEAYPSPTDIAAAPDPTWHYVIVTLKREVPEARSFRIIDGEVTEEPLVVVE